ncbi:hypothetical protein D3C71_1868810 [compost metagenome]
MPDIFGQINLKFKRLLVAHLLNLQIVADMLQLLLQRNAAVLGLKHESEILHQMADRLLHQLVALQIGKLEDDVQRIEEKMRINLRL